MSVELEEVKHCHGLLVNGFTVVLEDSINNLNTNGISFPSITTIIVMNLVTPVTIMVFYSFTHRFEGLAMALFSHRDEILI